MEKEILSVRATNNLKQLIKYITKAILDGAETVRYVHMESENPYLIFESDFTPEQERDYEIEKVKKDFYKKIEMLESDSYKTHSFRIEEFGLCGKDVSDLVDKFKLDNKIVKSMPIKIKKVITDEYDDFDEGKQTVFITEII